MKTKAFIYIILTGILWGTSGIFVHFLAPWGLSSLQLTFIRSVVSAVLMAAYVFFKDKRLFKANIWELFLYFGGGAGMFLTASCYYASMQASSVSTAVVLMYTAPIFVMTYSVAFLGERLTKLKLFSVLCMLAGCALVSGIIGGMKFSTWGILLGLMSGISYSAYNIFTKIQMRRGCNPLSASMYCFIFAALLSLLFSKPMEIFEIAATSPLWVSVAMVLCGICTCILPYFLYTLALRSLPVGVAAALGIVEPMAATLFSVFLLGEVLTVPSLCGIILILGSVFMLSRSSE